MWWRMVTVAGFESFWGSINSCSSAPISQCITHDSRFSSSEYESEEINQPPSVDMHSLTVSKPQTPSPTNHIQTPAMISLRRASAPGFRHFKQSLLCYTAKRKKEKRSGHSWVQFPPLVCSWVLLFFRLPEQHRAVWIRGVNWRSEEDQGAGGPRSSAGMAASTDRLSDLNYDAL